jgi:hypothetical protein
MAAAVLATARSFFGGLITPLDGLLLAAVPPTASRLAGSKNFFMRNRQ